VTVRIKSVRVGICEHQHPRLSFHHTHVWDMSFRRCLKLSDGTWIYELEFQNEVSETKVPQ